MSNLQQANKKVKESTIINQQKLASEAKKTLQLSKHLESLEKMSKEMTAGSRYVVFTMCAISLSVRKDSPTFFLFSLAVGAAAMVPINRTMK